MKKHTTEWLDGATRPEMPEEEAYAELLAEVAELKAPDPGELYWRSFQNRLEQRIDRQAASQRSTRRRLLAGLLPVLAAAATLFVLFLPERTPRNEDLDNLSEDSLLVLSSLYDQDEEKASLELPESLSALEEFWADPMDLEDLQREDLLLLLQDFSSEG
jgi:hypothetical protein